MQIPLALICFSVVMLVPGCTGLPPKGESMRNAVHCIVNMAQTTLVHIKKLRTKLPVAPPVEVSSPSIEGLTSISRDLGLLDNELQSPALELVSQIQADVSSLEGRVRSLALTMDCTVPARVKSEISEDVFPDSYMYVSLMKVQHYLEKLLLNKDKLKVC
ncbi:leptin b [Myripristis murdjan]|uniref:leptin b n=1 Tax=Myripristis murdjan TaxID=586833 RepID=UPI001175DDF7|nr:leptin-B-like [Myripristis murdjan]